MLSEQDKIKLQTFLNTLQTKCKERDSSVSVSCSYNIVSNDWDIILEYETGREVYVVAKDWFDEWGWFRKYEV